MSILPFNPVECVHELARHEWMGSNIEKWSAKNWIALSKQSRTHPYDPVMTASLIKSAICSRPDLISGSADKKYIENIFSVTEKLRLDHYNSSIYQSEISAIAQDIENFVFNHHKNIYKTDCNTITRSLILRLLEKIINTKPDHLLQTFYKSNFVKHFCNIENREICILNHSSSKFRLLILDAFEKCCNTLEKGTFQSPTDLELEYLSEMLLAIAKQTTDVDFIRQIFLLAAHSNLLEVVDKMLSEGLITPKDKAIGLEALSTAFRQGHPDIVRRLVNSGFNPAESLTKPQGILSPLMHYCAYVKVRENAARDETTLAIFCKRMTPLLEFLKQKCPIPRTEPLVNLISFDESILKNRLTLRFYHYVVQLLFVRGDEESVKCALKIALKKGIASVGIYCIKHHPALIEKMSIDDRRKWVCNLIAQGSLKGAIALVEGGILKGNSRHAAAKNSPLLRLIQGLQYSIEQNVDMKEEHRMLVLKLTQALIDANEDVNQKLPIGRLAEKSCSCLEWCFLNQIEKYKPLLKDLARTLLDAGANLSPRLVGEMKLETRATKTEEYLPYLRAQSKIEAAEAELLLRESEGITIEGSQLIEAKIEMEKFLRLHHLDPWKIPSSIEHYRELKKKLNFARTSQDIALKQAYESFCAVYNQVVDHSIALKELRRFSQKIRELSRQTPDSRTIPLDLCRFYGLWSGDESYSKSNVLARINKLFTNKRGVYWTAMRQAFLTQLQKIQEMRLMASIVWAHGTQSSSIPSMLHVQGLMAMGQLLESGVVPFCGQVGGTEKTINNKFISGECLTLDWNEGENLLQKSLSRILVNLMYASKNEGYFDNEKTFDPAKSWVRVTPQNVQRLMLKPEDREWSVIRVDILRLRLTDPEADKKLMPLLEYVQELLKQDESLEHLKNLHHALTISIKYQISTDMMELLTHPFPVIFASNSLKTKASSATVRDCNQFFVEGPVKFGKDIQFAFTDHNHVSKLQEILKSSNVTVLDLEVLLCLETVKMMQGSALDSVKNGHPIERLAWRMQNDLLPLYTIPFPQFGQVEESYKTYIKSVENEEILPRLIHGTMHASRSVLWSLVLAKLYSIPNVNLELLGCYMCGHDLLRQRDKGKDEWDAASAAWVTSYLQAQGFKRKILEPYEFAIANKDPKGGHFTSKLQQLFHDADSLEYRRVLASDNGFDKSKLQFIKENLIPEAQADALIAEIHDFIGMTDTAEVKIQFERKTTNFLMDLILLLHTHKARFPRLSCILE